MCNSYRYKKINYFSESENKTLKNRFKDNYYYFNDEVDSDVKNQRLGKIR